MIQETSVNKTTWGQAKNGLIKLWYYYPDTYSKRLATQIMSSPIDQAKIEEILKLDQVNVRRVILSSLLDRAKDHQRHHSGTR